MQHAHRLAMHSYRELQRETQERERFEEEVLCAHKWLDDMSVPRADGDGKVYSLVGRMTRMRDLAV